MVSTPITLHLTEPTGFLVSLWLQRNAVINADAKICKFLEMLIGFNCSDWDA